MVRRNKYLNCKVELDGQKFDSRKEFGRYCYLKQLLDNGEITDLECQKRFLLIPKQKLPTPIQMANGKMQRYEKEVTYIADFAYKDADGHLHVEDVKGASTRKLAAFVIKKKLMLSVWGIQLELI